MIKLLTGIDEEQRNVNEVSRRRRSLNNIRFTPEMEGN